MMTSTKDKIAIVTAVCTGIAAILTSLGSWWSMDSSNALIFASLFNMARDEAAQAREEVDQLRSEIEAEIDILRETIQRGNTRSMSTGAPLSPYVNDHRPECQHDADCSIEHLCRGNQCVPSAVATPITKSLKTIPKRSNDIQDFQELEEVIQKTKTPWRPEKFQ